MKVLLQEAATLTGKSEATVRRLAKKPNASQHVSKDGEGRLLIGLDFLHKYYPPIAPKIPLQPVAIEPSTTTHQPEEVKQQPADTEALHPAYAIALAAKDETIQELKRQLNKKDEQIASFQELLKRDQDLAAGKLLSQQVQKVPESDKTDKTDTIKKKKRWWQF